MPRGQPRLLPLLSARIQWLGDDTVARESLVSWSSPVQVLKITPWTPCDEVGFTTCCGQQHIGIMNLARNPQTNKDCHPFRVKRVPCSMHCLGGSICLVICLALAVGTTIFGNAYLGVFSFVSVSSSIRGLPRLLQCLASVLAMVVWLTAGVMFLVARDDGS
jgi:hypothetical protein